MEFIWAHNAYPHRGRIAFDGANYAAYYGVSISLWENCVDPARRATGVNIHQGDRFTVVDSGGTRLDQQGTEFSCSHSFWQRLVWDPAAARFISVCMTDNDNRLSLGADLSYATIRPLDEFWQVTVGGLTLHPDGSYWLNASDGESVGSENGDVFLLRFGVAGETPTLIAGWSVSDTTGSSARFLDNRPRQLHVQVRDRTTGAAVGDALAVDVSTNAYQDFRVFADGSVAYPAAGDTSTSVKILRILPCDG
jgi:hypothetical protein